MTAREGPSVSRERPAHAKAPPRPHGAGDAPDEAEPAVSAEAQALRDLEPPPHGQPFWSDLDRRLADEPQLRLAPRSAIRPITQPPPVVDDSSLAGRLTGDGAPARPRRSRWRLAGGLAVVLLALAALAALTDTDSGTDGEVATGPAGSGAATPDPTSATTAPPDTEPPPTTAPGTVDAAEPLAPGGVGPLRVGARLGELVDAGVVLQVDQRTFDGSGGSCYDARVRGALDLKLRFRSPDGQVRVDDPAQGVLASVTIETARPTVRSTVSGIALGASPEDVLAAHPGGLDERSHPFAAGGVIYRADNGDGTGISYRTDGLTVTSIAVGYMDIIRYINQCR
jgi:hypothetical protein